MKNIFIALLILSSSAIAQINLVVHGGLESTSQYFVKSSQRDFLGESWSNAIGVSIGTEFVLSKHFLLNPKIEYSYYKWSQYNVSAMIPEEKIISVEGDNSHIYRIILESEYYPSPNTSGLYFLTGVGTAYETIGQIREIFSMGGSTFLGHLDYPSKTYLFHSIGLGFRTNIVKNGSLDANMKFFNDYSEHSYISYNLGFVFSLGE